jgi:hypothetical protein
LDILACYELTAALFKVLNQGIFLHAFAFIPRGKFEFVLKFSSFYLLFPFL